MGKTVNNLNKSLEDSLDLSEYSKTDHTHNYASSSHTHNYAGSSSAGGAATSANKVNANLAIKLNGGTTEGTNLFTFNGSAAKTINITPSTIGAAASSHGTHVAYSTTAPKVAGTAAVGNESTVARGDHVHAAQTSVSGNAGTATKLKTAVNITIGSKTNTFDGSGNLNYTLDDIGAAAKSHGTHLTIGTGASNAAAGNHTHNYAGSSSAGGAANSVKTNLIIKLNGGATEGTNLFTFNGSAAKTVNITPSGIGAATSSSVGTLSSLKTSAKGNLVAAINELFQSANSGKQLIADAIGNESITVNSTFSAMSEAILALKSGGGLNIISATELPATGKENQICVITDNPINNYVVTSNLNDNANADSITLYNVGESTSMMPIVISSNGVTNYNYISQVCQGSSTLASYVYYTGQWIPLTSASHYLLKNGTHVTDPVLDKLGTFKSGYIAGTGLRIPIDSSSYYVNIMLCNKSVDFSSLNFSKVKVTAYTSTAGLLPYLYVVSSNQTGQLRSSLMSNISPYLYDQSSVHASYGATKHTYEIDISNWRSSTGYFGIGGTWSGSSTGTLYITDIEFK